MKTQDAADPIGFRYEDLRRELNLASYFLDRNDSERTALVTDAGPISYGRLSARANQVGHALRALGLGRRDRVLTAVTDSVEFVATWYGAQKIGAVTMEVYNYLSPADYRRYVDYVAPSLVLADATTLGPLRAAQVRNLLVLGVPPDQLRDGEHHYDTLVGAQPTDLQPVAVAADDTTIWKFTTGSTGAPKACVLAARSAVLSFQWYARGVLDIRPDDLVLPVPKLFFGYARDLAAMFPFGVGAASVIFPDRSTADRIFELIATHRPTLLVNVPTMMSAMVNHPDAARQDLSCLRLCTSAGEALPAELHRRWLDTFGVEVIDGIGSSEAYHIYVSNRPGQVRLGSVGQAVPGYRLRVVDRDGRAVPDGEVGRLEITGETVATEYWRAPEKSAGTFPSSHTVRSGDLVSRDAEGYYHYHGRADDLLKVGGRWVAPAEVENCLYAHPSVVDCAVLAYQAEGLTRLRAYVVTNEETPTADILDFLRARLTPHKYPRDIRAVDRLPRTASGKLDRQALAELG